MMKILTYNVRQWTRDTKKSEPTYWKKRADDIKKFIKEKDPDIIFFQELTFPMTCCVPDGYKRVSGLSISHHIYCKKNIKVKEHEWHIHWCRALLDMGDGNLVNAFSVHSHWDEKIYKKVATDIFSRLKLDIKDPVLNVCGGDWNVDPEVMEPLLWSLYIKKTGKETFQNWTKPESHGQLDYFGVWPDVNSDIYLFKKPQTSDHDPVMINIYDDKHGRKF